MLTELVDFLQFCLWGKEKVLTEKVQCSVRPLRSNNNLQESISKAQLIIQFSRTLDFTALQNYF